MHFIKIIFLLALAAGLSLASCKSENQSNNTTNTTTSAPEASSASPTPAPLADKLSKIKEVHLPFVVNAKIDAKSLSLVSDADFEAVQKDYGFTFDLGDMEIPSAAFRAKISADLQILGMLYGSQVPNGVCQNVTLRLFKNDGTGVGEPVVFEYQRSMSNMYAAGETDITIKIEADKITRSGTSTSIDPNGEKADEVEKIPETQNAITASGISK